ncbi:MAG: AraC family transcriptional regulator [Filomicrobium sp.]
MLDKSATRTATSVRILCDAAAEFGVERAKCLTGTGIEEAELYLTNSRITLGQEIRAIENFVRAMPEKWGLGVEVGKRYHTNTFGIWGFAILTSPTIRAAIETATTYANLSFLIAEMALVEDERATRIVFDTSALPAHVGTFAFERHVAITLSFLKELSPNFDLSKSSVESREQDAAYGELLSKMLQVEVTCGQPINALVLDDETLDQPLPKADPVTQEYCLGQCRTLLEQQTGRLPEWSQKVRDVAMADIGTEIRINTVAEKLAVTERTLRRRLTEEGTSFRKVYTDTRLGIAYELLETTGMTVQAAAWRVGYAEPAAFVRAFIKQYGKSPGSIRNKE